MYWSRNISLGNQVISKNISRDRFLLISSKLYFNQPEKPNDAPKIYYIDEVVNCLREKFLKSRTDSSFQSIDESMAKFKGRSSLKPVKRGIKLWTRCDSTTGYVYDTSIYSGKENEVVEGTLAVVLKLSETIKKNVVLCFDRFFTSVKLLDNLRFPALGSFIRTRINTPKFFMKLDQRGECEMVGCEEGILGIRWKDTKDVWLDEQLS
ncbi:hypothetical protein JTB14_004138 [Gonioctena quinquepunctata]|nr:hypothetical protein JTB14_004138 [Gonioctena quinquepunctata]